MKVSLVVTADCGGCDWTAGPVPGSRWEEINKAAAKHVAPGHPVATLAVPAPVKHAGENLR